MAAVADTAVDLHRSVGGFADQPVGAIVGHRHLVGDLQMMVTVQFAGGVVNQQTDHLSLGLQFHQGPLNRLADGQGLPNVTRRLAYWTARSMQYWAAPRLLAACRIRFSCRKVWATASP